MEDDLNKKLTQWKTTSIEDDLIIFECPAPACLFYYRIMTDMAKTYISAGPYRRAVQH